MKSGQAFAVRMKRIKYVRKMSTSENLRQQGYPVIMRDQSLKHISFDVTFKTSTVDDTATTER